MGVGTFSLKTSERKAENPPRINSLFSNFWWSCCVIVGEKSAKNRERKKKEKWWAFLHSEKTEFWRPKSKWILRNGRKNPHQYHIIGDRGREPFHLSPLFVGRFSFLKYFSCIADRWRCGRVDVSVPYSVLLCAIVRLFYLTLLCPRLKLGCRQVFKCCLTR